MDSNVLPLILPFIDSLSLPSLLVNSDFKLCVFDYLAHQGQTFLKNCVTDGYGEFHSRTIFLQSGKKIINTATNICFLDKLVKDLKSMLPFCDVLTLSLKLLNQFSDFGTMNCVQSFTILKNLISLPSFQSQVISRLPDITLSSWELSCFIPCFRTKFNRKWNQQSKYFLQNDLDFDLSFETLVFCQAAGKTQTLCQKMKTFFNKFQDFPTDLLHLSFMHTHLDEFYDKLQSHPFWRFMSVDQKKSIITTFCPRLFYSYDHNALYQQIKNRFDSIENSYFMEDVGLDYHYLSLVMSFVHPISINTVMNRIPYFVHLFEFEIDRKDAYQGFHILASLSEERFMVLKSITSNFVIASLADQLLQLFARTRTSEFIERMLEFYHLHYNIFPIELPPILIILMNPFDFWFLLRFKRNMKAKGQKMTLQQWLLLTPFKAEHQKYIHRQSRLVNWDEWLNFYLPILPLPKLIYFFDHIFPEIINNTSFVDSAFEAINCLCYFELNDVRSFNNVYEMMNVFNGIQSLE